MILVAEETIGEDDMKSATISPCGNYRYTLTRALKGTGPSILFVMLNPSTADALQDDPTIRRCIGFANRENASDLCVLNLYAWRATDPRELREVIDPVGPSNNIYLRHAAASKCRIVCAWGGNAPHATRVMSVLKMFREAGTQLLCLGTNKDGSPKHPLYLAADTPLIEYTGETPCQKGARGRG